MSGVFNRGVGSGGEVDEVVVGLVFGCDFRVVRGDGDGDDDKSIIIIILPSPSSCHRQTLILFMKP